MAGVLFVPLNDLYVQQCLLLAHQLIINIEEFKPDAYHIQKRDLYIIRPKMHSERKSF